MYTGHNIKFTTQIVVSCRQLHIIRWKACWQSRRCATCGDVMTGWGAVPRYRWACVLGRVLFSRANSTQNELSVVLAQNRFF